MELREERTQAGREREGDKLDCLFVLEENRGLVTASAQLRALAEYLLLEVMHVSSSPLTP